MTENALAVIEQNDVIIARDPKQVLSEAHRAAAALNDVVKKKKKPVIFNGENYLEFEDWQTVGRFYGVTAKIIETKYVEYGTAIGFEAKAVALRADGMEISAAEAMCLNDERNWKGKPLFQLKSMAQTRAASKALRNVLAWVVVLAGYKPTPAEEMQELIQEKPMKVVPPAPEKTPLGASSEATEEIQDVPEIAKPVPDHSKGYKCPNLKNKFVSGKICSECEKLVGCSTHE